MRGTLIVFYGGYMKRTISIILFITIIVCISTHAFSIEPISPLWDNTHSVYATLDFSGTKGTFTASIIGNTDVTDIYLMAWLYYKDSNGEWIEQTTWGAISSESTLGMDRTFTGVSGVEYKVDYTVYVYVGLNCDEISFSEYDTCP